MALSRLNDDEEYVSVNIPEIIKKDPNRFKFTMLDETKNSIGFFGEKRIKLLKLAFKTIIDNIVPEYINGYMALLNHKPYNKLLQVTKSTKSDSKPYKYFKPSEPK